jgi:hypothetical protein
LNRFGAKAGRSTFRRSIARLVPQPGQNTSSQGVPAISAARIVGDHSMSRLAASCSFQRSTTAFAAARAAASATCRFALGNVEASCQHAHRRSIRGIEPSIQPMRLASCGDR